MDTSSIKSEKIDRLLGRLSDSKAEDREEAFSALCLYFSPEDVARVTDCLLKQRDTQSLYWLTRYFVAVESPEVFKRLSLLVESEHEEVRGQTLACLLRVSERPRLNLLIRLLDSPRNENVCFAARNLAELGPSKAVFPLLEVLEKNSDEKVRVEIARALGRLRDPRAVRFLEKLVESPSETLQEASIQALLQLSVNVGDRFLKRCCGSLSPRVREFAYAAILRIQGSRWEGQIAEALASEKYDRIQLNILSSLRTIQTRKLFGQVFRLACDAPLLGLRTMAQSVLRRIKSSRHLKWLLEEAQAPDASGREMALRLMAHYGRHPLVYQTYENFFLGSSPDKIKLMSLALMGQLENSRGIPLLHKVIRGKTAFAYAAAVSFFESARVPCWDTMEEILSNDQTSAEISAVFLSGILHVPGSYPVPESMQLRIRRMMDHRDRSLRYLAVRASRHVRNADLLQKLLRIAALDADPGVRRAALKSVLEMVSAEPKKLTPLASICFTVMELFPVVEDIFRLIPAGTLENFRGIVKNLLDLIARCEALPPEKGRSDAEKLMSLARNLANAEKTFFLQMIAQPDWTGPERRLLLEILNRTDLHTLEGLRVDFMAAQYREGSSEVKTEFLKFFARMRAQSPEIEKMICASLEYEKDDRVRQKCYETLSGWISKEKAIGTHD